MAQDNLLIDGWEDDEYKAFVDKFKGKKTTDDCYTPEKVFEAVTSWVEREYGLQRSDFVRPFWPGGDYERFDYAPGCAVVDNPPFSILTKIIRFYCRKGIRFFLFAPALVLFNLASECEVCYLPCGVSITYANGAKIATSFVTNLEREALRVRTAPELYRAVKTADDENKKADAKELPKYIYPDNIITAAMVQRWCKYGVSYSLTRLDSRPIDALDAQRRRGISIFGNGFLLSSRAAAERAAAERWALSEAELKMVEIIDAAAKKQEDVTNEL